MSEVHTASERACVVSADTHVGPLVTEYEPYCEKRWRRQFEEFVASQNTEDGHFDDEEGGSSIATSRVSDFPQDYLEAMFGHVHATGDSDPHQRLRDLERDGIAGQVVFHGSENGQPLPFARDVGLIPVSRDLALGRVGIRMYNRWLADFCSVAPDRTAGIAQLPVWDPVECVAEVEWARQNGLKGINLPAIRPYDASIPLYPEPVWDPFFAACESLDIPLVSHSAGMEPAAALRYGGLGALALNMAESSLLTRRTAGWLIFGGVFQRHPQLRWVITETQGSWIETDLGYMDSTYFTRPQAELRQRMPDPPSAQWHKHVYLGASFMSNKEVKEYLRLGLEDRVMWGSDYPHLEGTWPRSKESLQIAVAGVDSDVVSKLIGSTAIRVYSLNAVALQVIANRIGPTLEELVHPPNAPVAHSEWTLGFREVGPYT